MNSIRRYLLRAIWIFFALVVSGAGRLSAQTMNADSPRWQFFETHQDSFDIVFVGSSRIYHGISPRLFDQITAAAGHRWRSFNLGVDKMKPAACFALARRVVALQPRRLKYVFFELQARTGPGAPQQDEGVTKRSEESFLSCGLIQAAFGSGRGLGPDGDGFYPLEKEMTSQVRPIYEERLRTAKEHSDKRPLDPVMRNELSDLARELAAKNIPVIFVVAPSLRAAHGSGVDAPPGSPLFSFDDLVRYASLYDEANRMDAEHLNVRGAEIFSRTLAQEFVARAGSTAH